MMEKHGGTFMRFQLDNIIWLSKVVRLNERARRTCLLCRATLNSTLQAEYDHLAHHLLDVALLVLPALDNEDAEPPLELSEFELEDHDDDSRSEFYQPPELITDLQKPKTYAKDEVVPFTMDKILGHDSFGVLYSSLCTAGSTQGNIYAIKSERIIGSRASRGRQEQLRSQINDVRNLARIRYVHVVSVVGCFLQSKPETFNLILLPMADLDLDTLIREQKDAPFGAHRAIKTK
jgi:hypothetical protein